jgi:hypothetical protein
MHSNDIIKNRFVVEYTKYEQKKEKIEFTYMHNVMKAESVGSEVSISI